jgi:hypothetical protein
MMDVAIGVQQIQQQIMEIRQRLSMVSQSISTAVLDAFQLTGRRAGRPKPATVTPGGPCPVPSPV